MRAPALALLIAVSLAAGLAACGGSGSSGSSSTAPQSSFTTAPTTAGGAGSAANGKPAGSAAVPNAAAARSGKTANGSAPGSSPQGSSGGGESSGGGGSKKKGAAGFVVAGGDNSIPNYGGESSSSERDEAAAALAAYLKARAASDWSTACSYMGAPLRSQVEILAAAAGKKSKGCAASLATLAEKAPGEEAEIPFSGSLAAFRVKGEHAFALFYGPRQQQYMMPMVSEGGGWKMGVIVPVPYPPGAPNGG